MEAMKCPVCEKVADKKMMGTYNISCAKCCARHLLIARNSNVMRQFLLESILFFNKEANKEDILREYKSMLQSEQQNTR